jgi:hypothetical protein
MERNKAERKVEISIKEEREYIKMKRTKKEINKESRKHKIKQRKKNKVATKVMYHPMTCNS